MRVSLGASLTLRTVKSEEGKREELRVKRDEGRLAVALAGLAAGVVRLGNCRDSKYFSFRPLTATQQALYAVFCTFLFCTLLHSFAVFCTLLQSAET